MTTQMTKEQFGDHAVSVIEPFVKAIVNHPEDAKVNCILGSQTIIIEADVHTDDRGKLIGKGGKMAKAMRTMLHGIGNRHRFQCKLDIVE